MLFEFRNVRDFVYMFIAMKETITKQRPPNEFQSAQKKNNEWTKHTYQTMYKA